MGSLLAGNAPLRGRAGLALVVPTLDFRLAAEFWGIDDAHTAVLTNAIVGGTPAYRREFVQDDVPAGPGDFDAWAVRAVLNAARPLFREARYLLAEEPDLRDTALYHWVLGAIADGNATRGGIANYLGRRSTDLAHSLGVLEDIGMVIHEVDAFRKNRATFHIAEPLITFYHAIMRPVWGDLERPSRAPAVWQRAKHVFLAQVVGPHLERLCREWVRWYASAETCGGYVSRVASGTVNDPSAHTTHDVDVAAFGRDDDGREVLQAIGEATWHETMGAEHLQRLEHLRDLLRTRHGAAATMRLLCFSGHGFTGDLHRRAAADESVQLIDLNRLYRGE
ncbi:AAA family ATPase [Phytoactinopolyspora halotolerans]|uniref:AAA family ATPase n=1 Tax=Phytoactinopolyspora halotolerans TaxID=1981512 RepID=UPI001C204FDE|nr:hypothetical protein [Phytoactinopolyspora halotolerans]